MLDSIITSKARRSVLKLFLINPDRPFHVNEVARLTGEPLTAVAREVRRFTKAGLLKSQKSGNQKQYTVNKDFPIYSELKKIIYATVGLGDYLSARIAGWEEIESAFIYGSVADDREVIGSDIDLMLVGMACEEDVHHAVLQAEQDIGRTINYTLISPGEFRKRVRDKEPFFFRILSEKKIILKGVPGGN
jgi:predicted nucleotidyltransferase